MINNVLQYSGSLLIRFPGLNNFLLGYKKQSLRIVYYHMISERENQPFYFKNKSISPDEFRSHIRFLKKHYHIITLEEATELMASNKSLTGKLVITFDDGFRENYTIIAPILREEKVWATFYLITDCIDNANLMWRNVILTVLDKTKRNRLDLANNLIKDFQLKPPTRSEFFLDWSYRTWEMKEKENIAKSLWEMSEIGSIESFLDKEKPYLTKNQIKSLLSEGFSIGSHSKSHPDFSKLNYSEFQEEILGSKQFLDQTFGTNIRTFSYPFGERASVDFENKLRSEIDEDFLFLGINNKLNNYGITELERDNLEFDSGLMMFRFTLLPLLRRLKNSFWE